MTQLPLPKSALYVCVDDDSGHRSRLEAITHDAIVIAAPADAKRLVAAEVGSHLTVFWIDEGGRVVLPVLLEDITTGSSERWRLRPLGEPRQAGRRQHERGGGGEKMRISTLAAQPAVTFDSTLLDLSEKALRCWAPASDIAVGEELHIQVVLSTGVLSHIGKVTIVREAPDGIGQHIVVTFHPLTAPTVQIIRRYLFVWGGRRARQPEHATTTGTAFANAGTRGAAVGATPG
ncbi:PilZ domain-containing protein [Planomonospora sp. ID67723]|uniref:PilZ domain-containing protein n=1 Tax=Planomonospora sp. ID67723 TaxID=2738134 RepID=UPI0018C37A8C|nr:PilZ domain-containing protein [Planomonospora sp. ID67723]MBG0833116.1 PilZ domain-containing protein [Planomonospora sp. ID67723]